MDIVDLREFYGSRLGLATRKVLTARLRQAVAGLDRSRVMGLGFTLPYLADCLPEADVQLAFMMARQGVFRWPEDGAVRSALVDECDLPLLESTVDVALLIHALEFSEVPEEMLREAWRVLAPQGKLIIVVPNRRGIWAQFDTSPFGYGQPYSRSQLSRLLKDTQFSVSAWSRALYFPPSTHGPVLSAAVALEGLGSRLMPALSGVIVVEAVKQIYAISSGKRVRRLGARGRPALAGAPITSAGIRVRVP